MMSKAVLLSIKPRHCGLICTLLGRNIGIYKKRLELRKTKPKLDTPFKCYIYCTKDRKLNFWTGKKYSYADERSHNLFDKCGNGKVIAEFICDYIMGGCEMRNADIAEQMSCISREDILKYSNGKEVFGWHISNLKIYDKPKELSEFKQCHKCEFYANCYEHEYSCDGVYNLTRPPQSWCYVESEVQEAQQCFLI